MDSITDTDDFKDFKILYFKLFMEIYKSDYGGEVFENTELELKLKELMREQGVVDMAVNDRLKQIV